MAKSVTFSTMFSLSGFLMGVFTMLTGWIPAYIAYLVVIAALVLALVLFFKYRNDPEAGKAVLGNLIISTLALFAIVIVPIVVGVWFVSSTSTLIKN